MGLHCRAIALTLKPEGEWWFDAVPIRLDWMEWWIVDALEGRETAGLQDEHGARKELAVGTAGSVRFSTLYSSGFKYYPDAPAQWKLHDPNTSTTYTNKAQQLWAIQMGLTQIAHPTQLFFQEWVNKRETYWYSSCERDTGFMSQI